MAFYVPLVQDSHMVEATTVGLLAAGVVLLFVGAALSVYGVALLGAVVGGGGGYLFAPTIAEVLGIAAPVSTAAAVGGGLLVGAVLSYSLLSVAIAATSFVVGAYLGLVVLAGLLVDGPAHMEWIVAIGIGFGAALLGLILTKTTLIITTAAGGAALLSRSVTIADLEQARDTLSADPLLFEVSWPFLALFVLGVLWQFGLFRFGYVARIAALLPGASVFRNRGDDSEA